MVDDDELDVEAFKRTLKKQKIVNPFFHAKDGIEALEMLRGQCADIAISRPLIILMDINMPRMNGLECIQAIRDDRDLSDIIIFVMTTSADDKDIYEAYNLKVAGYMIKSELGDNFITSIEMLDKYCQAIVLPRD